MRNVSAKMTEENRKGRKFPYLARHNFFLRPDQDQKALPTAQYIVIAQNEPWPSLIKLISLVGGY